MSTATMPDNLKSLEERLRNTQREENALWTALYIAKMDPHSRSDLACYMKALNEAVSENDTERVEYIIDSIAEVFFAPDVETDGDLDDWIKDSKKKVEGNKAHAARKSENERFLARYQELKAAAGFSTQQEVADACELSVNTVNAFETQKVKPQTRTLQKLAKGLGADLKDLLGA